MGDFSIILLTLTACAFFSGTEIAFISANKLRLELLSKQGNSTATLLAEFAKTPSKFISTTLVGYNVSLVIYSIIMENKVLHPFLSSILPDNLNDEIFMVFLETLFSTLFILFTADFLPKVFFRINPDITLQIVAYPFLFFYYLFYPFVHFITWLARKLLSGIFRIEWLEGYSEFSRIDLDRYISESTTVNVEEDAEVDTEIFRNALEFRDIKVRECMIPRTELIAISVNNSMEDLLKLFIESNHSKILIFEDTIDNITGYVHQNSMFGKPLSIKNCLIPIIIANESMPAADLLNNMMMEHKSLAVIVDEFGGTAGVVSIEDILEEILGEIKDEHDIENLTENEISEQNYIFSARLEIDYLNQKYNLKIPPGDYETLGGYLLFLFQSIPSAGDKTQDNLFIYKVLSSENNVIGDIELIHLPS